MPQRHHRSAPTVVSETSADLHPGQFGSVDPALFELFYRMQELTYPEEKRKHLACPFWKFCPREYRNVRNSNCLFWGFRDIGELNEHIQRRHLKSNKTKGTEKGDHVPVMNSKQEAKWKQGNWKKAGSTESKWWKIAKAVTGFSIAEDERSVDFHYHFPGPDIYLIQRFDSFRLTGSEGSESDLEEPRAYHAADAMDQHRHRKSSRRSGHSHDQGSPDSSGSRTSGSSGSGGSWPSSRGYSGETEDEQAEMGGFSDPFDPRPKPSHYVIPQGTDSAYYSHEGNQLDDSGYSLGGGGGGQSYMTANSGAGMMDYVSGTGVLGGGAEFMDQAMPDIGSGAMYGNYPTNIAESDFEIGGY